MKTLILAMTLFSVNAFAWGPTGHRTVGLVAERFLNTDTLIKVFEILDNQTMARVSTWPDEVKSEPATYSHTYNWHYTDWSDASHDHDETISSGKLIGAINEQVSVLKDAKASKDKKAFALKFLIHLIGDVHMPLHVGNGLDRGGNACKVLFHNQTTNLHALWDEGMINFTGLSFTELTSFIMQGKSREQILAWKSGNVLDWAQESKKLRSHIYPAETVPGSEPLSVKQYCRTDITVTKEDMPKLGYEYSYKFVPVLEQRLFQAGVRLAMVLNEALK